MPSSAENVLAAVRSQILNGARAPGDRISEVGVAAELNVSRTPARTALTALEAEGLIEKREGRGYTVRSISATDVAKAVEVRAVLEGLAARTLAETGMTAEVEATLAGCIAESQAMLVSDDPETELVSGYFRANTLFHETIMTHCGNELIAHTFERIAMLPLAALGTVAFDPTSDKRERLRLTVGHSQHVIIFDAIKKGDGQRAEAMMREHSLATVNYTDLFAKADDEARRAAE